MGATSQADTTMLISCGPHLRNQRAKSNVPHVCCYWTRCHLVCIRWDRRAHGVRRAVVGFGCPVSREALEAQRYVVIARRLLRSTAEVSGWSCYPICEISDRVRRARCFAMRSQNTSRCVTRSARRIQRGVGWVRQLNFAYNENGCQKN